jgi:hypothetical protein
MVHTKDEINTVHMSYCINSQKKKKSYCIILFLRGEKGSCCNRRAVDTSKVINHEINRERAYVLDNLLIA